MTDVKRLEKVPLWLRLPEAPIGTPTYRILEVDGTTEVVAAAPLTGSGQFWNGTYTVAADAVFDAIYRIEYSWVNAAGTQVMHASYRVVEFRISGLDAELTSTHGAGAWTTPVGSGTYATTVHCKDGSEVDIPGVNISVHNASNDDSPTVATGTTDSNGNAVVNLNAGTYYIRAYKPLYSFDNINPTISASGTVQMPGSGTVIPSPSDPEICRLYIYPITLDNQDVTDLTIIIQSYDRLTKVNGEFIKNTHRSFTYDSSTAPDSYYFDAVQGTSVNITCPELWKGTKNVPVPTESTKNLYDLIS
jgi:hypothetical protein